MEFRFAPFLISVVVGVVLVVTMLIPIVSDATATEKTFTNEGAFYIEVDPTDTYTVEYDHSTEPGVVYVNGEKLNVTFTTGYTILAIDNAILRTQTGSGGDSLQYKGNGQYLVGITMVDLEVSNGEITGTYVGSGGTEQSWPETTYTECHIASPTPQDYVMTAYNSTSKMLGDSPIFAFGQTLLQDSAPYLLLFKIEGTIADGVTVSALNQTTGEPVTTVTISDIVINYTEVDGYVGLYDLTSITFSVDSNGYNTDVTYSAYIVPSKVTAELSQHMSDTEIALMSIIPLLVVIGLIIGVVYVVGRRAELF